MQNDGFIANYESVACIVATLIANNLLSMFGVDVNNFTFTFIAPLGADNDDVCHVVLRVVLNCKLSRFDRVLSHAARLTICCSDQGQFFL